MSTETLIPPQTTPAATPLPGPFRRALNHPATRGLLRSRLFWAVLALKVVCGSVLASSYLRDLFTPFVNYFVESGFQNPWEHFAALGKLRSFPYPPMMLYVLAVPRALFEWVLPAGVDSVTFGHLFVMRLPLLLCDFAIALLLAFWFPQRLRLVLILYWCSPLSFYITYWHGQLDVVPTALFLVSFFFLRRKQFLAYAVVYGLALATKSHLWIAVPFLGVYLWRLIGLRGAATWIGLQVIIAFAIQAPYLAGPGYRQMVLGSEEQMRALALQIPLGADGLAVVVAPLALALLWLRFEAYPKTNWDLLMAYLGLVFCVFIVLAPPRPGYFLWSLPFLVYYYCRQDERHFVPLHLYTLLCLVFFFTGPESDLLDAWSLVVPARDLQAPEAWLTGVLGRASVVSLRNLVFAGMFAAMTAMLLPMYLIGVRSNRVYRARTKPMLLGLAGDSGAGKDSFCRLLQDVLGSKRCLTISGDDYHRWPRGHSMWQVHTHLDVRANDLLRQQNHAIAIAQGEGIVKGTYDHNTGQFTSEEWVGPQSYVVFAGLHTLALESQRRLYELTVFLDPEESLRRAWKVRRDHAERGYEPEQVVAKIQERDADRCKFILPQADHADIIVRYRPMAPLDPCDLAATVPLELQVIASNSYSLPVLADVLRTMPGLEVEHDGFMNTRQQSIVVRGTIDSVQVHAVAEAVVPNLDELSDLPAFAADLNGCLQLILLTCLSDKQRWSELAVPGRR